MIGDKKWERKMHNINYMQVGLGVLGCGLAMAATPAAAFSCTPQVNTTTSPYSQSKYQTVINNSQALQVQSTSTCLSTADMQDHEIDSDNWHLDGANMWFGFSGGNKSDRVELRGSSFSGSATGKKWTGKVKILFGGSYSTGFTVGQIFGESTQDRSCGSNSMPAAAASAIISGRSIARARAARRWNISTWARRPRPPLRR
jgi:hypothetical protein